MVHALIFAGGVGSRMNSKAKPKQFLEIHGKPVIIHTIEQFEFHPDIDSICVVIVKEWLEYAQMLIQKYNLRKVKWIVQGGKNALESQYNGLFAIQQSEVYAEDSIVLIHDGVRPLINSKLISDCIDSVREYGSAITVAPAIETIIRTDQADIITETVERSECQLARAPQCFLMKDILEAHAAVKEESRTEFIDSVSMMLYLGRKLHTVEGPTENIKVTNPSDFYVCRALLDARESSQIYGI